MAFEACEPIFFLMTSQVLVFGCNLTLTNIYNLDMSTEEVLFGAFVFAKSSLDFYAGNY